MVILQIVFFIMLFLIIVFSLHNAFFGYEDYKGATIVVCMAVAIVTGGITFFS